LSEVEPLSLRSNERLADLDRNVQWGNVSVQHVAFLLNRDQRTEDQRIASAVEGGPRFPRSATEWRFNWRLSSQRRKGD